MVQRGGKKLNMIDGLFLCGPAGRSCLFLTVRFAPAGAGPSFRVNEKKQKVTQGTTFLENPPSLRGCLVTLRPLDWLVCCQCRGPVPVLTSAHSSTEGRHCRLRRQQPSRQPAGLPGCRAARGTGVWRFGVLGGQLGEFSEKSSSTISFAAGRWAEGT